MKYFGILLLLVSVLAPEDSHAGLFELSGSFSFNRTNYSSESFAWNRRWSGGIAYHFSDRSGVEASFQSIVSRVLISGVQDTTFNDKIYSINWVQSILGKRYMFQPYFKVGLGQLNRDATGSYSGGGSPPRQLDSLTVILALGTKLFVTKRIAIKGEATSYISGGSIGTWKDNISINFGASVYF